MSLRNTLNFVHRLGTQSLSLCFEFKTYAQGLHCLSRDSVSHLILWRKTQRGSLHDQCVTRPVSSLLRDQYVIHTMCASIALSMCNKQDQSNCLSQVSGGCWRPSLGKVGVIMVLNNPRHRMPSFFLCAMMRALLRPGQRLHIIWRANHPPHLGSHFITTIQLRAPPYGIWLPGTRVSLQHSKSF